MALCGLAASQHRLDGVLHVTYPHPASHEERQAALRCSARYAVPFYEIRITLDATALGIGTGAEGARVVPHRNSILLSIGAHVAEQVEASEVWIGCTADDHADYADCRPRFIHRMDNALAPIRVRAPFILLTRAKILELEFDVEGAWSCYQPTEDGGQCGECNSCKQQ